MNIMNMTLLTVMAPFLMNGVQINAPFEGIRVSERGINIENVRYTNSLKTEGVSNFRMEREELYYWPSYWEVMTSI